MSNVSTWGLRVEGFVSTQSFALDGQMWDVIMIQEHHLLHDGLLALAKRMRPRGYRLVGVPAIPKDGGTSGGVLTLVRTCMAIYPVRGSRCVDQECPMLGHGLDWVAVEVHLRGALAVLVNVYFTTGVGMDYPNSEEWAQIRSFVSLITGAVIVAGDFNDTPERIVEGFGGA